MAIVKKQMTPLEFAVLTRSIAINMDKTRPVMRKLKDRYEKSGRRNARTGKQATGDAMPPLTQLTLDGNIPNETDTAPMSKGKRNPVTIKRSSKGNVPMKATQKMVRAFKGKLTRNGFVLRVMDDERLAVSAMHMRNVSIRVTKSMQKHLASVHNMKVKVGTILKRPARIPFALSSRQVKRSVTDLNKFIFKDLFG